MADETKLPRLKAGDTPPWWSMKGNKMHPGQPSHEHLVLSIANNRVATLDIVWDVERWKVGWFINHGVGTVTGTLLMMTDQLKAAFGLAESVPGQNPWYAKRFNATAGDEGLFIRTGRHLSLPCPGNALFGDPNIAVFLTDEIREAVAKLIEYAERST